MKTRATIIISLSLMLIALIAAMPMQAQATSIDNAKWEGVDSDDGKWEISWDTVTGENYAWLNFNDCGVTSVWLAVSDSNLSFERVNEKTHMKFPPLNNNIAGQTCNLQVVVQSCVTVTTTTWTEAGSSTSTSTNCNKPQAYIDVTFPN